MSVKAAAPVVVEEIEESTAADGSSIFVDAKSGRHRDLEDVRLPPGWTWRTNWRCEDAKYGQKRTWKRIREGPIVAEIHAGLDAGSVQKQILSLQQLLDSDVEHLESLAARIGGNLDCEDLRARIRLHCALAEVHISAEPTLTKALARFESETKSDQDRNCLQQTREMLEKGLRRQRVKLETVLWSVRDRIKAIPVPRLVNVKSVDMVHENVHEVPLRPSQRAQRDQELATEMLLQSTLDVNAEFFQDREQDLKDIEQEMRTTRDLMSGIAENVHVQRERLDHIYEQAANAEESASTCICS
mmetsp:Transcript_4052/g.8718  ORF Transcript_4052/g.8718 Transcript_4052/m.8718 type:complete len:301 (+) Transcript_4052:162-1064(+)